MFSEAFAAKELKALCKTSSESAHMERNFCSGGHQCDGIMNARRLAMILEAGLLPFMAEKFTDGHRLFHDNDPKHASNYIDHFFKTKNVN